MPCTKTTEIAPVGFLSHSPCISPPPLISYDVRITEAMNAVNMEAINLTFKYRTHYGNYKALANLKELYGLWDDLLVQLMVCIISLDP